MELDEVEFGIPNSSCDVSKQRICTTPADSNLGQHAQLVDSLSEQEFMQSTSRMDSVLISEAMNKGFFELEDDSMEDQSLKGVFQHFQVNVLDDDDAKIRSRAFRRNEQEVDKQYDFAYECLKQGSRYPVVSVSI